MLDPVQRHSRQPRRRRPIPSRVELLEPRTLLSAGPRLVADINTTPLSGDPHNSVTANGLTYFVADDGVHGSELWVTDGTAAGTRLVDDALPGPDGAAPQSLRAVGGSLYFVAPVLYPDDGDADTLPQSVPQLWRTDGTAAGTIALTAAGQVTSLPSDAVYLNHAIYFMTDDGLWRTDGTAVGTGLIKSGTFYELVAAGGNVYFGGPDLWRSDGTAAGTKLVGSFDDAMNFTAVGSYVCFAGENSSPGTLNVTSKVLISGEWLRSENTISRPDF